MSIDQDRDYYFLQHLVNSPGQRIGKFEGTKAKPKGLELDGPAKKAVESRLVSANFVTLSGKGADKKYTLTPSGEVYFKTLTPFPRIDPKLKAFVLLNLLAGGDRYATLKQVKAMLTPAAAKTFNSSKDSLTPLLETLVQERAVEPSTGQGATADDRALYRLTDSGRRGLVHLRQHVDVAFKLTGGAINQLIETAAGRPIATEPVSQPPVVQPGHQAENLVALAASGSFSDDELIRDAKTLMSSRGTNGLLPIFELRRHVKQKFGERAGGLEEFDKRLKRLRGERLDLISLYDQSSHNREQINEGVQGVGELFFYVKNLR